MRTGKVETVVAAPSDQAYDVVFLDRDPVMGVQFLVADSGRAGR